MSVVLPAPFAPTRPDDLTGNDGEIDVNDAAVSAVRLRQLARLDHQLAAQARRQGCVTTAAG